MAWRWQHACFCRPPLTYLAVTFSEVAANAATSPVISTSVTSNPSSFSDSKKISASHPCRAHRSLHRMLR